MTLLWIVFLGAATSAVVLFVESLLRDGSLMDLGPEPGASRGATSARLRPSRGPRRHRTELPEESPAGADLR
jgi:hypothetical protein